MSASQRVVQDNAVVDEVRRALDGLPFHPAWAHDFRGGGEGFSLPATDGLMVVVVTTATLPWLTQRGIKVVELSGDDHRIVLRADASHDVEIRYRSNDSLLILGRIRNLHLRVRFEGRGSHVCVLGDSPGTVSVTATFRHRYAGLLIGAGGSANSVNALCEGPGRSVQIGDDMMLGDRVDLRTSDSHGIVSLDEPGRALNPPESVVVGPHVWLAAEAVVMKGCRIGRGAIVGGRAVVTADVPDHALVAGVPARVIRRRVTWTRDSQPGAAATAEAIRLATGPVMAGHGGPPSG